MDKAATLICPLCAGTAISHFHSDSRRDYYRCANCLLVFVPAEQHLSLAGEKSIYDLHRNVYSDEGYRRFLGRLCEPLCQHLQPPACGLDFGCGPGPVLAQMLGLQGFDMTLFDPIYGNNTSALERRYDFITCTETVEHFFHPGREFKLLFSLLKPCGWLGIMTKQVIDRQAFAGWHYKNDPTHVSFFSRQTFHCLAKEFQADVHFYGSDVILLQKLSR